MPDEQSDQRRRQAGTVGTSYVEVRELARTRWATTRLVRDPESDRLLVVKSLPLEGIDDPKVVELFVREAEVLAGLDHPRIPRFVDSWAEESSGGDVEAPDERSIHNHSGVGPKSIRAHVLEFGCGDQRKVIPSRVIQSGSVTVSELTLDPPNPDGRYYSIDLQARLRGVQVGRGHLTFRVRDTQ